ncbi:STE/STE20 protein kinase [Rhizophagus clarus]|uniref:STE/STE20 protein kinase n=1 Tax=Rhizophagus clarus TaxID=94130 RepID=A0A8H3KR02_9GLOM|nr:STE/STE20 protein kinase [Rhizophagus clarus]
MEKISGLKLYVKFNGFKQVLRFAHDRAPAYSLYPSTSGSCFELYTLGNVLYTKDKYLCGHILDDRYFLLGTNVSLDFIDLSLPSEQQIPKRLIHNVRFKQLSVLQTGRYGALLAIAGKNNHIRSYDLCSLRLLIRSKMSHQISQVSPKSPTTPRSPGSHGRARSVDSIFEPEFSIPDRNSQIRRSMTMEDLNSTVNYSSPTGSSNNLQVNGIINNNSSASSSASSSRPSSPLPPRHCRRHTRHSSHQNPLSLITNSVASVEAHERHQNLPVQWALDYFKLPSTRMTLSFVIRSGPTRTYLAALSKQNIFLFELDYGDVAREPEFVHTRTYWLPQTPKFLQMSMHEDQLIDIIAVFHTEVIFIGIEDARVREISVSELRSSNMNNKPSDPENITWQTFTQLPWIPTLDPEFVSESFTIPPPYNLIINEDPSAMLNPIPVFETGNIDSLDSPNAPSLFFATFGSKSMIVDSKGRPFSTIVFQWTYPLIHVEFLKPSQTGGESYIVGFGKNMVEVRSFNTGRIVENVVRGVDVVYLGRGRNSRDVIWGCSFNKSSKGVCLYRLDGPLR